MPTTSDVADRLRGVGLRTTRPRVRSHHRHLVCRSCGIITDVDDAWGNTACLAAADDPGYAVDQPEVVHRGRCPTVPGRSDRVRRVIAVPEFDTLIVVGSEGPELMTRSPKLIGKV